ncbi:hypothetical protein [Rodentibacter caecimuris]|uniref:hypothetical protein n=1 Tax=Rodentibacter caecimuris TaxID=1796644 RepID=UPI00211A34B2|nr:hypothetical protein [Rodentibacter heylii]MCQ9124343.1 hypothetical protein [Rodentibacter heylii]
MAKLKIISANFKNKERGEITKSKISIQTGLFSINDYTVNDLELLEKATPESLQKAGFPSLFIADPTNSKNTIIVFKSKKGEAAIVEVPIKEFQALQGGFIEVQINPTKEKKGENLTLKEWGQFAIGIIIIGLIVKSCVFSRDDKPKEPAKETAENVPLVEDTGYKLPPPEKTQSVQQTKVEPKKIEDFIAPYAVEVMKKKDFPKAYAKYGDKYISQVNKLAPEIAKFAAKQAQCDRVEMVTFSDSKSSKQEKVWFVDCANKERLYITENQLKSGEAIKSNAQKAQEYDYFPLIEACGRLIQSQLKFPSTYDEAWLGKEQGMSPNGTFWVRIPFEAKNAMGNKLPQVGECTDEGKGKVKLISIRNR